MNELQSQLLAEYISLAYDIIGAQPLSPQQEELLITTCLQQVEDASYPHTSNDERGNQR